MAADSLAPYRAKRDFTRTREPRGDASQHPSAALAFIIQKHAASHLHFDLRLELDGVMKSWAVPKGLSLDPSVKRLAMQVEDHPLEYNSFEGTIPAGEYGGGTVMLWDRGTYTPDERAARESAADAVRRGLKEGKLAFTFHGERLRGSFALVRTGTRGGARDGDERHWLLIKHRDAEASSSRDLVREVTTSVESGRTMDEITVGATLPPMAPVESDTLDDGWWAVEPLLAGDAVVRPVQDERGQAHLLHVVARNGAADVVVDLLVEGREILIDEPWTERQRRLELLLSAHRLDRPVERVTWQVVTADELAPCMHANDWPAVIAKRVDAPYEAGASEHWRIVRRPPRGASAAMPRRTPTARATSSPRSRASSRIPTHANDCVVRAGMHTLSLTNLHKPFWPALGISKGDLLRFYEAVAPVLVPHLRQRAMVMKRYPHGAEGPFFFMKRTPDPHPEWLETCRIEHASGNVIDFPVVQDLASLLWVVNLGCIDLNPWYARCDDVHRPDVLHFDLDPGPGADFARVRETAQHLKVLLDELALPAIAKTSGSKGLHVYVPIVRGPVQKAVWAVAKAIAQEMERRHPRLVTAEYRIAKRPHGRVLVDYNQNAWGRTLASVYSVRPRPDATVSMPVTWEEIAAGVRLDAFTLRTVPAQLAERGDLWRPILQARGRVRLDVPALG
jgi:bifunctional non-homologous end joining protein LigD